ncbi:MAG: sulfide/dihydroorotate dehydrogenase-like FAD/NAD-binding protein [Deltaproteobacteria bacterium]|nr:sulfide/dihydroorotate dehydrogenase-like FAD/NAD-binding protein [Candidatus Anaeroferrophillacea bacterium]
MNRIIAKAEYSRDPAVKMMEIEAPAIARKAKGGQFIVLRVSETGERIPLTIADTDVDRGTVTIVFQEVGKTTADLGRLEEGDEILDFIGPLGQPTHMDNYGAVLCIAGGIGIAPVHNIIRELKRHGNRVITIMGARTQDLLFWEDKMRAVSDEVHVTTDDGSYGRKGLVTAVEQELLEADRDARDISLVIGIGPPIMMKFVAKTSEPFGVKTLVSLNSIMVDATGMCGACRVTVGGKTRFVCVDGPEFDGHQVDFDELMQRQRMYLEQEKRSMELLLQHRAGCDCGGCRQEEI